MSLKRKLFIVFLFVTIFIVSLVVFLEILKNQKAIARSESEKHRSYLLADELRQNSDDLTQMVRAYVATGESHFREYFQKILDIRAGKIPRPKN